MNRVILIGRMIKDPELRQTQNGTSVCSFTLAVERRFKQEGGKTADFINCVAWKGLAEFISKYFVKGQRCALEGSLQMRDWTDKDGNKRTSAEVLVDQAEFCDSKRNEGGVSVSAGDDREFTELNDDDGDLPF